MAPGLQEGASLALSHLPSDAFVHAFVCSLNWKHVNMWPQQPHSSWPHAGSRGMPEMNSCWEQAKLPGSGLWLLALCLQAPTDCTRKWTKNSEHWLLSFHYQDNLIFSMAERGAGLLWNGSLHSSRLCCTWIKLLSILHLHLPHEFGFFGDKQLNFCLLLLFNYNICVVTLIFLL